MTNIDQSNQTTRCYPRTMREAFPFDYAYMFEHYKRKRNKNYVVWGLCIVAIILFLIQIRNW